ncbi:MAG: calcium/sodium antiporter [Gammaproteobacteria bacterium]|jgi:cation:H+ antiporter|nr:calcium/sodium antiporter [Gammaproteobacteria bacterium]
MPVDSLLTNSFVIIIGFILLIWSADRFIYGAAAAALNLNISPLIIGLTIVGFGTSAPEMMVAAFASLDGSPAMAIGNALGSNITNITLVLGTTALIVPLNVHSGILKKELPLLLIATLLTVALLIDGALGFIDGLLLFGALVLGMWWITRTALKERNHDVIEDEFKDEIPQDVSMPKAIFWLVAGLILLIASSKILVWGAVNVATSMGISELVIGLTIIAIGTSLPELAATVVGALKNEHDIAIGNIVGSNLFNTLGVLAIPGLIAPAQLAEGILTRDLPVVFALTTALFAFAYGFRQPGRITRVEGGLLLAAFFAYQTLLYFTA